MPILSRYLTFGALMSLFLFFSVANIPFEQVDALAMMLKGIGIEKCIVKSESAGGPTAYHFAAKYPEICKYY